MLMCLDYFRFVCTLRVFYFSHTFAFLLGVRDENTRQIDCFTAHFVAEGGRGVPCLLLVNKFISTYEYKNIRQCPA